MNQKTIKALKKVATATILFSFFLMTTLLLLITFEIQYELFRQYKFFVIGVLAILFGLIVICPFLLRFLNRRETNLRSKDFSAIAREFGWNFTENPQTPDFISHLLRNLQTKPDEFNLLKSKTLSLTTGKFEKYDVAVFDQSFNLEDAGDQISSQQTIVAVYFPHKNFPLFVCEPKDYFGNISKIISKNVVSIPANSGFSMRYVVYGRNPDQVRQIFKPNVVAHLEQMLELTTIGDGNCLLCFSYGKLLSKNEIRQRLKLLIDLTKIFEF